MNPLLRVRRYRALRAIPELAADTPEGARVQLTGVARAIGEPLVAPLCGAPCVAARVRCRPHGDAEARTRRTSAPPLYASTFEQLVIAPFALEADERRVLLRDGVERPTDSLAFRGARAACKLVGNKRTPS